MAWYILAPGIRVSSECVRSYFLPFPLFVSALNFSMSPIRTNPTQPKAKRWSKKKLLTRFDFVRVTRPVCVQMLTKEFIIVASFLPHSFCVFLSDMPRFRTPSNMGEIGARLFVAHDYRLNRYHTPDSVTSTVSRAVEIVQMNHFVLRTQSGFLSFSHHFFLSLFFNFVTTCFTVRFRGNFTHCRRSSSQCQQF